MVRTGRIPGQLTRPIKPKKPCTVCGNPTTSRFGICWRTLPCQRKYRELQRREKGVAPKQKLPPIPHAILAKVVLGSQLNYESIAEKLGVSRNQVKRTMETKDWKFCWKVPQSIEMPESNKELRRQWTDKKTSRMAGLQTVKKIYYMMRDNWGMTAAACAKKVKKSATTVGEVMQMVGARIEWQARPKDVV